MRSFDLLLRFPGGGPLIGGQTAHAAGAHAVHTRDRLGQPVVPSTAIRGALRESLEALLRGTGKPACMGGDGHLHDDVVHAQAPPTEREACIIDGGGRCLPCRLFGSSRDRLDPGETASSGLVLADARLDTEHAGWYTRSGVAIERARRSAHDKALVFQRVPAGRDLCFVAEGRLRAPELAYALEAAARATTHIGASRSRGLGHVEITMRWHDAGATAASPSATKSPSLLPAHGDLYLRVTLEAPASFGVAVVERNFRDTRHDVPGSAVRGAVGFALAELVADVNQDPAFLALVDPERGAHFGFLQLVQESTTSEIGHGVGALPITAATCKVARRDHGVSDTLLDRLVLTQACSTEEATRVPAWARQRCPVCQSPLRGASGSRRSADTPRTRVVTRVAMDRTRGSGRNEYLFTEMLLEAGTRFEGFVRNVPPEGRARLAQALGSGIVSLGRGRAMGWGRIRLDVQSADQAMPRLPLAERRASFVRVLSARLVAAKFSDDLARRLVPVTLLSPLDAGDDDGERTLTEALGGLGCAFKARRFTREGGWDLSRTGKGMQPVLATAAGGVFVIELAEDTSGPDITARIEYVEQHGVGNRRHQGFGQVLCFDPFHLTGQSARSDAENTIQEHDDMDATQRLRPYRKELVLAAEKVMQEITASGRTGKADNDKAGKSQLSRLSAVCNEAAYAEEIVNYLRYQASREGGFWTPQGVDRVIDELATARANAEKRLDRKMDDADLVHAWRLYAVYMARSFTYETKRSQGKSNPESRGSNRERSSDRRSR
jgi:CRISPR/Cas system CSM-associated protein Csm3 (group 7 of RAMP superfamily)